MGFRIVTWNVNGIRNPFNYQPWREKRSYADMFDILQADIVVLQETKIQRKDLKDDMVLVPGWDCYFSLPKHEKGKFGVVIYTRQATCAPIRAEEGLTGTLLAPASNTRFCDLPEDQQIGGYPSVAQAQDAPDANETSTDFDSLDCEGRCVLLEFPAFVLLGLYCPAQRDETRTIFRINFFNLLDARIRNLTSMGKRVVVMGDLNVSKAAIDMANAEAELRKAGVTVEEFFSRPTRRMFNHLLDDGNVIGERDATRATPVLKDLVRHFHPNRLGMFTHWETKVNARPGNYGSRIDYILASLEMQNWFEEANIQEGLHGSDHCPVYAVIKDVIDMRGQEVHIRDLMSPTGVFVDGKRVQAYSTKLILPMSGRMIDEFNGRQSIRDLFKRKASSTLEAVEDSQIDSGPKDHSGMVAQAGLSPQKTMTVPSTTISPVKPPLTTGKPTKAALVSKSAKKQKTSATTTASKTGQQSLRGFFTAQTSPHSATSTIKAGAETKLAETVATPLRAATPPPQLDGATTLSPSTPLQRVSTTQSATASPSVSVTAESGTCHDPVQAKEGWNKLFSRPIAPKCESHDEPCKMMLSKKKGQNFMRYFWMCARDLGPSGQKEKGTEWRCSTFIWASDWDAKHGK